MFSAFFGKLVKFRSAQSANVAIMFALLAPLLVGATGFAIDYARAAFIEQQMTASAQAAVLSAVSQSAAKAMGGYSNTVGLKNYGLGIFNLNTSKSPVVGLSATIDVSKASDGTVQSSLTYHANVSTIFSGIIGFKSINISGYANASARPNTYMNIYILVDVSQSMGIAATQSDMQLLYDRVIQFKNASNREPGCVFGCHVKSPIQNYTNEDLAHSYSPYISLRIDAAKTAIKGIIGDAASISGSQGNIKIGLYEINQDPNTGNSYNQITGPSSDYTDLLKQADNIDLGDNQPKGIGDTDFNAELTSFGKTLSGNGAGTSPDSPLNYVFIITDGLSDIYGSCFGGTHCTGPFDPTLCDPLKSKATVGVIYTTYIPIYNGNDPNSGFEANYTKLVLPYVAQIAPNLKKCASSSSFYFEAIDGPAIDVGIKALFKTSLQQNAILTR